METANLFCEARCQNWKPELLPATNSFPGLSLHQAINDTWENGASDGCRGLGGGNGAAHPLPCQQPREAKQDGAGTWGKLLAPDSTGCKGTTQLDTKTLHFFPADLKLLNKALNQTGNQRHSLLPAPVAWAYGK